MFWGTGGPSGFPDDGPILQGRSLTLEAWDTVQHGVMA